MSTEEHAPNGLLRYRVDKIEGRVEGIEEKIDRLIGWAVVATFTLAGSAVLLALNLLLMQG